jgi:hypothetical protein
LVSTVPPRLMKWGIKVTSWPVNIQGCTIAHEKNRKSCHAAQASFAMTIVSM